MTPLFMLKMVTTHFFETVIHIY